MDMGIVPIAMGMGIVRGSMAGLLRRRGLPKSTVREYMDGHRGGGGIVVSSSIGTATTAPMPGCGEDLALTAAFGG